MQQLPRERTNYFWACIDERLRTYNPTIMDEVWLQTELPDGTFYCESFSGVPVARPSWIVLVSAGSQRGRSLVGELREALETVLLGASP
jgi:hypothetical protein